MDVTEPNGEKTKLAVVLVKSIKPAGTFSGMFLVEQFTFKTSVKLMCPVVEGFEE